MLPVKLKLELGKWTKKSINELLSESLSYGELENRLNHICYKFIGTPFIYESSLPILPDGVLRVRLESFDCITFIYNMIAMSRAGNFDEFVSNLRMLRYKDTETEGVKNDPFYGNIFDFTYNSLYENAINRGILEDVSEEISGGSGVEEVSTRLVQCKRIEKVDFLKKLVRPKMNENMELKVKTIPFRVMDRIEMDRIRTGDLMLFSRGDNVFVHVSIAIRQNSNIYSMLSTKHFAWRPGATEETPPDYTGFYYGGDPRREQIGVGVMGTWLRDVEPVSYNHKQKDRCGYDQSRPVVLQNYMKGTRMSSVNFLRLKS